MSTEEYNENEELQKEPGNSAYEEEEKPRKGSRVVLIVAVLVLVGLNVFLGINIYNQTEELKAKEKEIAMLDSQRTVLLARVDSLTTSLTSLNSDLAKKDSSITQLIQELDVLKKELSDKKSEVNTLLGYRQKYQDYLKYKSLAEEKEAQVDSLKTQLAAERRRADEAKVANDTLTQRLNELKDQAEKLNNKVSLGAKLTGKITEIVSLSEKKGKAKPTDKASQVNKVSIKYMIAANPIAPKENKTVYIVVKSGSKTITQEGFQVTFSKAKNTLDYTHKDELKYAGQETTSTPSFNLPPDLAAGKYSVEIYIDEVLFTTSDFTLR
jgi:DNA repair exonuclease SbcCD ATPase subunit